MQSLWRLEAETAISNKCLLRMTLFVTPGATTGAIDQPSTEDAIVSTLSQTMAPLNIAVKSAAIVSSFPPPDS